MGTMRKPIFLLLAVLISYLGLVMYANRVLFTTRFDEAYWKDKYEHSQWKLPLSIRTIGDDGLYLYEGYRIAKGGDPTLLNAEVPPFGKYLIGFTILLFGAAHLYGLWTILLLFALVYLLAKSILRHTGIALGITLLLATDPLITSQYALTMMDGLQAALLVLFLTLLFRLGGAKKRHLPFAVLASGLALGLFAETKAPVLAPVLTICGLTYVWFSTKKPWCLVWFLVWSAIGYLAPYLPYFLAGHTFFEWLGVQKWIASFYLHGNLTPTWGSVFTTLIAGRFQNIFSRVWETAPQWSPVWGLLFWGAIAGVFRLRNEKTSRLEWRILLSALFLIIGLYALIPFWTRYVVTVLPLLYIAGGYVVSELPAKRMYPIVIVCLIINLMTSVPILFPSPRETMRQFIHNTQYMFFADLYEDMTTEAKQNVSRGAFRRFGIQTMADGQIERIDIAPKTIPSKRTSPQHLSATVTYYTRELGSFTKNVSIPFVLEDNRWRIPWDWSYLLPGLTPDLHLETTVIPGRRGSILASDKMPLARDAESFLVSVTPDQIEPAKEQELLALLEALFGPDKPAGHLHQRIYGNSLGDIPVPVGVLPRALSPEEYATLSNYRGVTLTPHIARFKGKSDIVLIGDTANTHFFECCSYLYTTTTYDGITGVEKAKNTLLKGINGGTLTLKDSQGNILETLISREKRDGSNVEP